MQSRFIGGREASDHLISKSNYPFNNFNHTRVVKIWPGQYFAIYRFDESSVNPIVLAKAKIIDIGADDNGVYTKIIDCKTSDLYTVRHVPALACGYEIGIAVPHRAYIERTIKELSDNGQKNFVYGIATGLMLIHRGDPDLNEYDTDYMIDWFHLKDKFTDEGSYYKEIEKFN